jgi:hypothetical protein
VKNTTELNSFQKFPTPFQFQKWQARMKIKMSFQVSIISSDYRRLNDIFQVSHVTQLPCTNYFSFVGN